LADLSRAFHTGGAPGFRLSIAPPRAFCAMGFYRNPPLHRRQESGVRRRHDFPFRKAWDFYGKILTLKILSRIIDIYEVNISFFV